MSYNGYENQQTYTVAVWLDNVLIDNQMVFIELAELRERYPDNPHKVKTELSKYIRRRLEDKADYIRRSWDTKDNNGDPDDALGRIIIDFIDSSIEAVNFYEVASQFMGAE